MGVNGPEEVKSHPWLKDFKWDDLAQHKIKSPFVPTGVDNFDSKCINEEWKDINDETFKSNVELLRRGSIQQMFNGYYYDSSLAASQNSSATTMIVTG